MGHLFFLFFFIRGFCFFILGLPDPCFQKFSIKKSISSSFFNRDQPFNPVDRAKDCNSESVVILNEKKRFFSI